MSNRTRCIGIICSLLIILGCIVCSYFECNNSNEIITEEVDVPVYITIYGTKYHTEECQYLWHSKLETKKR